MLLIINLFTAVMNPTISIKPTRLHTKTAPIPLCFIIHHVHNTTIPHAASSQ